MPDQPGFAVRAEWGEQGVRALAPVCDAIVIVDVLSFTTSVCVACARGARVYPFVHGLDAEGEASAYAESLDAVLAARRDPAHPLQPSLSPVSLTALLPGTRLILPSPNGSTLSLEAARQLAGADAGVADDRPRVFAGCLRNAEAVARALLAHLRMGDRAVTIGVIPAGERWPDLALRPAIEDALGAGAVLVALDRAAAALGVTLTFSPEADLLATTFAAAHSAGPSRVHAMIRDSVSGRDLVVRGFADDVELATQCNVSSCAPGLVNGAYRDVAEGADAAKGADTEQAPRSD